jgi:hypothetical protein
METGWDGHTVRISYSKYPSLPGTLLSLLRSAGEGAEMDNQSTTAEAVFPVLDIIRRAGPPEDNRHELYSYIKEYLGSRLWHVREMAARTLCSFLIQDDWIDAVSELLERSLTEANRLHGTLLTIRFVLERKIEAATDLAIGKWHEVKITDGVANNNRFSQSSTSCGNPEPSTSSQQNCTLEPRSASSSA